MIVASFECFLTPHKHLPLAASLPVVAPSRARETLKALLIPQYIV